MTHSVPTRRASDLLVKAHYVCLNIECGQVALDELEHSFRYNDAILRHLVIKTKKPVTAASLMMKSVEREEARKARAETTTASQSEEYRQCFPGLLREPVCSNRHCHRSQRTEKRR